MARAKKAKGTKTIKQVAAEAETDILRGAFRKLMRNALHCATKEEWMSAVKALAGDNPTPEDWVRAAEQATTKCDRCGGTGTYQWGACVNGHMTHSGCCFRCEGKGHHTQEDYRRNWGYDGRIKAY